MSNCPMICMCDACSRTHVPDSSDMYSDRWYKERTSALEKENKSLKERIEKYIEQTRLIDEHSEDFDEPCECKLCQSYMTQDI